MVNCSRNMNNQLNLLQLVMYFEIEVCNPLVGHAGIINWVSCLVGGCQGGAYHNEVSLNEAQILVPC
jgi:hypothetical protein